MVSAQFLNIGATTSLDLQSIKAVGTGTSDNVSLQTLDSHGYTVASYTWIDWAGPSGDQEAWADDEGNPIENVLIAPGTGLWIAGSSSAQAVQTCGAVGSSDVVVALRNGGTATGNPFPVAIDLQDILPVGAGTSDNVTLQKLDSHGYTTVSYTWIDWAGPSGDQEAWADDEGNPIEGVTINPGEGLWIAGSSAEQSIRFPAPQL